jgi:hypothetical protein
MVHFSFCIFYNINWTDLPLKCWTRMIIVLCIWIVLNCDADLLWLRIVLNCYAELLWIKFENNTRNWLEMICKRASAVNKSKRQSYCYGRASVFINFHLIAKLSD